MLSYPRINPICFSIGSFHIHWYAIAYIIGILIALYQGRYYIKRFQLNIKSFDDIVPWAVFGILIGGRLGYVLFYDLNFYLNNPREIIAVWRGGMAFHGGLSGCLVSFYFFSRKMRIPYLKLLDLISAICPVGIFLVRLTNFINGEIYGRVTSVPWAMVFPSGGPYPRHPSQLYEAFLEGIVLWFIVNFVYYKSYKQVGVTTGVGLFFYGLFRLFVEFFREPEIIFLQLTMGQILSLPMLLGGMVLILWSCKCKQKSFPD